MTGLRHAVLLGAVLMLAGCGSDVSDTGPGPVCAVHVTDPANGAALPVGLQRQLVASAETCDPEDQPPQEVAWGTSSSAIAAVTASGMVTGHTVGSAEITATIGGVEGSLLVQVVSADQPDDLPAPGAAAYTVAFIGAGQDTTFTYPATAITYVHTCINLQTLPGHDAYLGSTKFWTPDGQRPAVGVYPLRGITAPDELGTMTVYSIYNGYSSEITGTITVVRSTPAEIGATFDFSSPTEGREPNFTVRIHGSFLAIPNTDSLELCH